ncbi:cyanophycin synthetase [Desulfovibrio sp. ZJ200]|uniref:bifunctional folylpolyglutamate synthase/dihydrofolate synthase n=1 Tax=Desulfovibrio sp. ZJ200 TaxID=2709792 RepID=UPI0013EDA654|nr:cyanophycin synthetase [Desulfovibrio sp. ZJ200]
MRASFQNFQQVLAHLQGKGLFHMDLSLDRMRRALAALDLTRPPFAVAQILGTNGKGSTAAFLASLCAAHGCKTGLYISPHFVSPEERIRVDGRPWPGESWVAHAENILSVAPDLTYFEFLTVLALLIFRDERVDAAVLEAGLGGRHDATTAVAADLLCFTPIALDHKDVLGPSLRHIAADKAGAVRGPAPICTAAQFPVAARCLEDAALAHGAPLLWADPLPAPSPGGPSAAGLGLQGPHQLVNAGLALAAWRRLAPLLGKNADDVRAQAHGLARAFLPGRLQSVPAAREHPPLLLDGAHNPHGMRALLTALQQKNIRPAGAVFSCLGDKDWRTSALMLKHFLGPAPMFIPALDNPRAACAHEVAAACNALPPVTAVALDNLPEALTRSAAALGAGARADPARPLLLTGSLYLLAEFFTLHPNLLEAPAPVPAPDSGFGECFCGN